MREFRSWRAASHELADIVRTTGPRIALIGFVCAGFAAVPTIIRYYAVFG